MADIDVFQVDSRDDKADHVVVIRNVRAAFPERDHGPLGLHCNSIKVVPCWCTRSAVLSAPECKHADYTDESSQSKSVMMDFNPDRLFESLTRIRSQVVKTGMTTSSPYPRLPFQGDISRSYGSGVEEGLQEVSLTSTSGSDADQRCLELKPGVRILSAGPRRRVGRVWVIC